MCFVCFLEGFLGFFPEAPILRFIVSFLWGAVGKSMMTWGIVAKTMHQVLGSLNVFQVFAVAACKIIRKSFYPLSEATGSNLKRSTKLFTSLFFPLIF